MTEPEDGGPEVTVESCYGEGYVELLCDDVASLFGSFSLRQTRLIWDG